jgi:hypothetical protein
MRTTTTRSLLLRTLMVAVLAMAGSNATAQSSPQQCCGNPPDSNDCNAYFSYCMCDCGYWTSSPTGCGSGNYGMCLAACVSQGQGNGCW